MIIRFMRTLTGFYSNHSRFQSREKCVNIQIKPLFRWRPTTQDRIVVSLSFIQHASNRRYALQFDPKPVNWKVCNPSCDARVNNISGLFLITWPCIESYERAHRHIYILQVYYCVESTMCTLCVLECSRVIPQDFRSRTEFKSSSS